MSESLRRTYLKMLGLTPWVARTPLPGAAPTPLLEVEVADVATDESGIESAVASTSQTEVETGGGANSVPDAARSVLEGVRSKAPESNKPPEPDAPAKRSEQTSVAATAMTLQAHQVGDIWVLTEQDDASAPDLGREALQLLNSLLAIFPGERKGARKFIWPMPGMVLDDTALRKTFLSFAKGLGGRLLLCASEENCQRLLGNPRYAPVQSPVDILPISSLGEMLDQPAEHKRASWQAMLAAGLHG